ncbi:PREDICTED: uncharacterized protein LOC101306537 [Fragaria vesca subsp. vesca]|uniref:uncharacterized protein LOC101306537 n=1 Tax=Fragaria vesca subsp. vesca TaxID=101020 RepID=UPI0002C35313|nr:PREDICTED: uncharacterized protein LOC101306537 [Fragaria vesca subsp. vesca]
MLILRNSLFQKVDNKSFNELTVFLHPLQLGGVRSVGRIMQEFNLPISRQVRLIGKKISGVFMLLQIVLTTEGDEDMCSKFKMVVSVLRFLSRLRTNGSCVLKNILLGADRAEREIISLLSKVPPHPRGIRTTDWNSFGMNRINDYLKKVTKLAVSLDMSLSLTLMPCPPSSESLMVMRDVIEYYSERLTQLQQILWEDIIPSLKDEDYQLKVTSRIDKDLISVMKPYLQGLWK